LLLFFDKNGFDEKNIVPGSYSLYRNKKELDKSCWLYQYEKKYGHKNQLGPFLGNYMQALTKQKNSFCHGLSSFSITAVSQGPQFYLSLKCQNSGRYSEFSNSKEKKGKFFIYFLKLFVVSGKLYNTASFLFKATTVTHYRSTNPQSF
jgi:hypothetical protein